MIQAVVPAAAAAAAGDSTISRGRVVVVAVAGKEMIRFWGTAIDTWDMSVEPPQSTTPGRVPDGSGDKKETGSTVHRG